MRVARLLLMACAVAHRLTLGLILIASWYSAYVVHDTSDACYCWSLEQAFAAHVEFIRRLRLCRRQSSLQYPRKY